MNRLRANSLGIASALVLASCADAPKQATTVTARSEITKNLAADSNRETQPVVKDGRITSIPLGTFFQLQQAGKVLIFDVRPGFYYSLGHVPGAINWPRGRFDQQLAVHEKQLTDAVGAGKPVVLYCTDLACPDALHVADRLSKRGHSVAVLQGGWEAWKVGELPIE